MAILFPTYFSLLVLASQTLAQNFTFWNITQPVPGLDSTCISVLNQAIACNISVTTISLSRYESDTTLNSICTTGCSSALTTYIRRVQGACGGQRYTGDDGFLYLPMYRIENTFEQYQTLCLKNTAGKFCNAVIRDALSINPNNQATSSGAVAPASTVTCNECYISIAAQFVQMPIASAPEYATALSGMQKSCSKTVAVTSPNKTTWYLPPTATSSTTSCQGTQYIIKSGDTCQSIALAQGFSTAKLLSSNNLFAYCRKFPAAGSSLCLPSSARCAPYSVKSGDTCQSIASASKISFAQLVSWNPELGDLCGNLDHMINKTAVICTSTPGGAWVNPSPSSSTSTTSTPDPVFANTATAMSQFGSVQPKQTLTPNELYVTPYSNGTRLDCATYITPPVLINATSRTFSYSCTSVAKAYGIAVSDLLAWNPGINQTGGFTDPCELSGQLQYCVQDLPHISNDMTKNCTITMVAPPASSCSSFATMNNITQAAVIAWNPSVGTNCVNYQPGMTYCKVVSHFRSSDAISTCAYWAMANSSTTAICDAMASQYKITKDRFVAWNPSVLSDCSGAVKGYDYCVGTATIHPGFP